jgi:hypothetical protein
MEPMRSRSFLEADTPCRSAHRRRPGFQVQEVLTIEAQVIEPHT